MRAGFGRRAHRKETARAAADHDDVGVDRAADLGLRDFRGLAQPVGGIFVRGLAGVDDLDGDFALGLLDALLRRGHHGLRRDRRARDGVDFRSLSRHQGLLRRRWRGCLRRGRSAGMNGGRASWSCSLGLAAVPTLLFRRATDGMEKRVENGLKRVGPGEGPRPGRRTAEPRSGDERGREFSRGGGRRCRPVRPKEPVRPERPRKRTGRNAPRTCFRREDRQPGCRTQVKGECEIKGNPREMRRKSSRPGD